MPNKWKTRMVAELREALKSAEYALEWARHGLGDDVDMIEPSASLPRIIAELREAIELGADEND